MALFALVVLVELRLVSGDRHSDSHTCCAIAVFILGIFLGWGISPPQKKNSQFPPNGCQIVCSKSFLGRDNELQVYHGDFLLMDNKHRKLFVIKRSKGCKFMSKMHQNTFGGRAPPGPAGGAYALSQTP